MAYLKLRQVGSSAFCFATSCARVHFAVGGVLTDRMSSCVGFAAGRTIYRGFSGSATEGESEGAPVPAWKYRKLQAEIEQQKVKAEIKLEKMKLWKAKAERERAEKERWKAEKEHWRWRCNANAREYLASITEARLEILQYKYQLTARGIPALFIKSITIEAHLHCRKKVEAEHVSEEDRKFYEDFVINWFPQARKEIWRIVLEMPIMVSFKEDMQKMLSSQDLDLLVMKATAFHKELHHLHHRGMRQMKTITFVREHIRQGIHDRSVDPVHLEGFMQAMAKRINVNVVFVDEWEVSECADDKTINL